MRARSSWKRGGCRLGENRTTINELAGSIEIDQVGSIIEKCRETIGSETWRLFGVKRHLGTMDGEMHMRIG